LFTVLVFCSRSLSPFFSYQFSSPFNWSRSSSPSVNVSVNCFQSFFCYRSSSPFYCYRS
jgi:hypothetical protein